MHDYLMSGEKLQADYEQQMGKSIAEKAQKAAD